jgi:aminopeptidase YwaD
MSAIVMHKVKIIQNSHLFEIFLLLLFIFYVPENHAFGQDIEYARRIIHDLTQPAMYGRGFEYNGVEKAARYLIREYKQNGAIPINHTYYQWFRVNVNTFPGPVKLTVNNTKLRPGADYLVDPSSSGIKGSYIIRHPDIEDLLSDRGSDIDNQVKADYWLFIDFMKTDSLSEEQRNKLNPFREGKTGDRNFQTSGIIERFNKKLTWGSSAQCIGKPVIVIDKSIDPDTLYNMRVNIRNRMIHGKKTRNIYGLIKGTQKPDSFVVFTAHYDHIGSLGRDACFPGANDNASGVALMLSLMQYYALHPPAYTIFFLAPSAEELGLLGSSFFVEHPVIPLDKIRFLINLDLAGTGEEGITVVNADRFPLEFNKLQSINNKDSLLAAIRKRGESCNSDHCPFYEKEVPCFFLYTMGGSKAYHDIYDKAEALSLAAFVNYMKLIISFVEIL